MSAEGWLAIVFFLLTNVAASVWVIATINVKMTHVIQSHGQHERRIGRLEERAVITDNRLARIEGVNSV